MPPTELTWALILGLARHVVTENAALRAGGPWQSTVGVELGDRSRGLVGPAEIARMRRTAYLVNTARSAIVDRAALVDALVHGRIAGAGLDVFDEEPLPDDDVLRRLPNILATPHLGYVAHGNYRTYFREAVEDVAFVAGSPVRVLSGTLEG